jgi:hypothetical protein
MAFALGSLRGLDAATLALLKTDYIACLRAISVAQSYSIAGRTFTKANLDEVVALLAEITGAEAVASGVSVSTTYADFSA